VPPHWQKNLCDGVHFVEVEQGSQEWQEVLQEARGELSDVRAPCHAVDSVHLLQFCALHSDSRMPGACQAHAACKDIAPRHCGAVC
jgi:hypothetical protein